MSARSIVRCHLVRRLLALLNSEFTIDSRLSNSARLLLIALNTNSHRGDRITGLGIAIEPAKQKKACMAVYRRQIPVTQSIHQRFTALELTRRAATCYASEGKKL